MAPPGQALPARSRRLRPAAAALACLLCGCAAADYTSDLVDPETGRTPVVTWPARFGWGLGFVAGVPISLAGAPVSYTVYRLTPDPSPAYTFFLLFPSLVTSQVGTLLFGAPFDLLEFLAYRWWSGGEGGGPPAPGPGAPPSAEDEVRHGR